MDDHSPLYLLLEQGYKERREPQVEGVATFWSLLEKLDEPCQPRGASAQRTWPEEL
jgi:hypothetical protein